MLRAAIFFFILGLISFILGAGNIGGLSIEIGKFIFIGFIILSIISFVFSFLSKGKSKLKILPLLMTATLLGINPQEGVAEETVIEKIQNEIDDQVTEAKISARKVKKKVRDATDNESLVEDAKDAALNAKDRTKNEVRKAKRKLD